MIAALSQAGAADTLTKTGMLTARQSKENFRFCHLANRQITKNSAEMLCVYGNVKVCFYSVM
ncbi:MAG: hypothetical protein Q4G36_09935 [Paracoccus sp. (in: a-proteobacteria)]|nr:hypothetical protein [Paracoccus sp. (in: a-proteobacteria)]